MTSEELVRLLEKYDRHATIKVSMRAQGPDIKVLAVGFAAGISYDSTGPVITIRGEVQGANNGTTR